MSENIVRHGSAEITGATLIEFYPASDQSAEFEKTIWCGEMHSWSELSNLIASWKPLDPNAQLRVYVDNHRTGLAARLSY